MSMRAPLQIAFMTGQSDPASCALSIQQSTFLDALAAPEIATVRSNFPYTANSKPRTTPSLPRASWNNARQYLASRQPAFAERHRASVLTMLDGAERTVLLAGSCGLELLANLRLPQAILDRVHVFAYGAVARRRPVCDVLAVWGRRDVIARPWRRRDDHIVDCGHMTYLETPEVLTLCQEFIARRCSTLSILR
jgi:pimeloyl-ACP methyl ester carboxylesterase